MGNEAKITPHKFTVESDRGPQEIHPDWTIIVSNQLTIITQQSAMLENQSQMIAELRKIADPMLTGTIVKQQVMIVESINNLSVHIDDAREQLEGAVTKMSSAVWGLLKVPVACVVVGAASWAYLYSHVISENTWLLMLAVAVFPWLGDSITAITKMFGIGRQNNGGASRSNKPD